MYSLIDLDISCNCAYGCLAARSDISRIDCAFSGIRYVGVLAAGHIVHAHAAVFHRHIDVVVCRYILRHDIARARTYIDRSIRRHISANGNISFLCVQIHEITGHRICNSYGSIRCTRCNITCHMHGAVKGHTTSSVYLNSQIALCLNGIRYMQIAVTPRQGHIPSGFQFTILLDDDVLNTSRVCTSTS